MSNYKIYNDDCIDVFSSIGDNSVDLILTDPPYNLGKFIESRHANFHTYRSNHFSKTKWDNNDQDDWNLLMKLFFKESARTLKKGGTLLTFMSLIRVETMISLAKEFGFYYKTTGICHKTNPILRNMNLHFINSTEAWIYFVLDSKVGKFNGEGQPHHAFIETAVTHPKEKKFGYHPTQKSKALMEYFIKILSDEGDIILDPFMGSGTTGVAALNNDRKFIGIEKDEAYFQIASERILNS